MKNIRILLVSLAMLFMSLPVIFFDPETAQASAALQLIVTPSKTSANVGDEVTFTVSMSSAEGLGFGAFSFDIVLHEGMTYKPGSGAVAKAFKETTGLENVFFETDPLGVTGFGAVPGGYNGAGLEIATFVCTVTAAGTQTVTLTEVDCRNTSFPPAVIETVVIPAAVAVGIDTGEDEPPVFERNTWQLPAVSIKDVVLPLDGWNVKNVFLCANTGTENSFLKWEGTNIIVSGNAPPFRGIAKLANNGRIRYIGIEKFARASAGTAFDGSTWTIPHGFSGEATIEFDDWSVARVFSNEADGTVTTTDKSINVGGKTAPFSAIIKIRNEARRVKYIGIERE